MRRIFLVGALAAAVWLLTAAGAAAAPNASTVDLGVAAIELEYDPVRDVVYASVDDADPQLGNRVVKIDPATGKVLASVPVGSDPRALAISDDASYLYVGLLGASKVVRVDLATFTVDLEVDLPPGGSGPVYAIDLAVLPGEPTSFAVSRNFVRISPPGDGVAIYDGATMRPDTTPTHVGENSIVAGEPGTLYGTDLQGRHFYVVSVDASGAHRSSDTPGIADRRVETYVDGRVFGAHGLVVDVRGAAPKLDGTFALESRGGAFGHRPGDPTMFIAGELVTGSNVTPILIEEFDPATFTRVKRLELPKTEASPGDLVPLGDGRFLMTVAYPVTGGGWELWLVAPAATIEGTVTDRHDGQPIEGICALVSPFGDLQTIVADPVTDASGFFRATVPPGTYQVLYTDCKAYDYTAEWFGDTRIEPVEAVAGTTVDASFGLTTTDLTGLVDIGSGRWHLASPRESLVTSFFFGNPGDLPMVGDWDCDGDDTPGLYRQSDGFVYLRNSASQGIADIRFFFGDPGDVPLAGDFDGDGCDTVSIYRPSQSKVFVINELGSGEEGLGAADVDYFFGNPGDKPFVGDFDADFTDTIGLHRESTGLVYYRNSHTPGPADVEFVFGDPGDKIVAGNFDGFLLNTPAIYRPSDRVFYIRHENSRGPADRTETWDFADPTWLPVAGIFGL